MTHMVYRPPHASIDENNNDNSDCVANSIQKHQQQKQPRRHNSSPANVLKPMSTTTSAAMTRATVATTDRIIKQPPEYSVRLPHHQCCDETTINRLAPSDDDAWSSESMTSAVAPVVQLSCDSNAHVRGGSSPSGSSSGHIKSLIKDRVVDYVKRCLKQLNSLGRLVVFSGFSDSDIDNEASTTTTSKRGHNKSFVTSDTRRTMFGQRCLVLILACLNLLSMPGCCFAARQEGKSIFNYFYI